MTQQLATTGGEVLHSLVIHGDLTKMNDQQKVSYYVQFCESLGLNPVTQPFKILKFQGKEILYATKDATEQLRKLHGISVVELSTDNEGGTYTVTCKVKDKSGKTDMATGVVSIAGLNGEALANAKMKAETKAKRRATLSICGLGVLDESERDSIDSNAEVIDVRIPPYNRQAVTDEAFAKGMERIKKGEKELIHKMRANFNLSESQTNALVEFEDANVVTS